MQLIQEDPLGPQRGEALAGRVKASGDAPFLVLESLELRRFGSGSRDLPSDAPKANVPSATDDDAVIDIDTEHALGRIDHRLVGHVLAVRENPDVVDHVAYTALVDPTGKQRVLYDSSVKAAAVRTWARAWFWAAAFSPLRGATPCTARSRSSSRTSSARDCWRS